MELSLIAKEEGLLAMEEYAFCFGKDVITDAYFRDAIIHVVDGCDPKDVELFLSNDLLFYGADTFQGYLCYLIMQGVLSVQAGDSHALLMEKLLHCLPYEVREEAQECIEEVRRNYSGKQGEQ